MFRSFKELMSIVNAAATASSSSNGSGSSSVCSTNSGSSATPSAPAVPISGLEHLSNTAISNALAESGIDSATANASVSVSKPGDLVAQLLAHVGAAELFTSLPVSRDPKTGQFDLTLLHEQWRVWAENERLCIHID